MPGDVDALAAAMRLLVGVALRSLGAAGSVSLAQFRVLAALGDLGPTRPARVADALGLEPSTISRLTARLVTRGYLARSADPSNRSAVTLELTVRGRSLIAEVSRWRRAELARLLAELGEQEQAELVGALSGLVRAAGPWYDHGASYSLPLSDP